MIAYIGIATCAVLVSSYIATAKRESSERNAGIRTKAGACSVETEDQRPRGGTVHKVEWEQEYS